METSDMKQHLNSLLQEASEDDCIHDIVFQVTVNIYCFVSLCWFLINKRIMLITYFSNLNTAILPAWSRPYIYETSGTAVSL